MASTAHEILRSKIQEKINERQTENVTQQIQTKLYPRSTQRPPEEHHCRTHARWNPAVVACNAPLVAWRSRETNALGKRGITFDLHAAYVDMPLQINCGKCIGCKLDKARDWAIRCTHEAQMHEENTFVTLTYNEKNLPMLNGIPTLRPRDFQLFMKKLRRRRDNKLLYFQCGQYGQLGRPHHHALLFGCGFDDATIWRRSGDFNIYRSKELEALWTEGHSEIGTVTFESAGYLAKYTLNETEQVEGREPEYLTMSRRPGIGNTWLQKYISDVYPTDEIITPAGRKLRPPRYYDQQLEKINAELLTKIKRERLNNLTEEMKSGARRAATEKIQRAKAQLRRKEL